MSGLVGYLHLEGELHQTIKGSCLNEKHKDWIEVLQFSHEMGVPYNENDTALKGDTKQKPLRIWKEWDKSSPLLMEALAQGEHFKTVKIEWFRRIGNNKEPQVFFTHQLTTAKIVDIKSEMLHRDDETRLRYPQHMEEISFMFEKAEWIWKPDNVTGKFSIR